METRMNFDLASEDRHWLEKVAGVAADLTLTERAEQTDIQAARAAAGEILARLAAVGYLSMGFDNSTAERTVVDLAAMETLAAGARSAMLMAAMSTRVLGRALAAWGTEGQRERWLPP